MTAVDSNKILLLGVPLDRIPQENLEDVLIHLIESSVTDKKTKYATSITALFLGKLSGFTLNYRLMPQVVTTLRHADFIGINSKELQLLAKLLGNTIPSLIKPEDLLLASASLLAKHKQSIFLLGGSEDLCNRTKTALAWDFPGLKIVGAAAPGIYTKGLELNESIDSDEAIIEMINEANPTVLALHLGHPKQEIWLDRVKDKIKVPLIIGVGGAFERYLIRKQEQKPDLFSSFSWEKLKQKILSVLHYSLWIPPLLVYNSFNHLMYNTIYKSRKKPFSGPRLFLSKKESLFIEPLPSFVNRNSWEKVQQSMEAALEHENIVLDFSPVRHINPSGIGLLYAIWKQMRARNKNLFIIGVNGDIRCLLKLHGAWDLIEPSVVPGPDEVLQRLSINRSENLLKKRVFLSIDQVGNQTIISFFGKIHGYNLEEESGVQLEPVISDRSLNINLEYCTGISNLGFGFLLHVREYQKRQGQSLTIANASPFLIKKFKYYQVYQYFNFV